MTDRSKRYFMLQDIDLDITEGKVEDFIYLWEQGHTLMNIKKKLKMEYNDVCILLFDLCTKERVKPRPNGIWNNLSVMGDE